MSKSNPERRLFSRISFEAQTLISQGNKSWHVELIDLSLNGLLIRKPDNYQIETSVDLTAIITLNNDTTIEMDIQQKHIENDHIGFKCLHIDIESISHLRRLVELNLGDFSLLERELAALGT